MKDYHEEKFRNNSLKNYGLCQSHYLSSLALSWNAMLNVTKVELELNSDADIYFFLEKGMRDEVSSILYNDQNKNKNILYA